MIATGAQEIDSDLTGSRSSSPQFAEVYDNSFLRGSLILPALRLVAEILGLAFYLLLSLLLCYPACVLLRLKELDSLPTLGHAILEIIVLAGMAILGLVRAYRCTRGIFGVFRDFVRIAQSRTCVLSGQPLYCVEGPPTYSGGERTRRGYQTDPIQLHIGTRTFDLHCCGRRSKLLAVGPPLVDSRPRKSTDPGTGIGFVLDAPMRAWFDPSTGVLVRADMPAITLESIRQRIEVMIQRLIPYPGMPASTPLTRELAAAKLELSSGMTPEVQRKVMDVLWKADVQLFWRSVGKGAAD